MLDAAVPRGQRIRDRRRPGRANAARPADVRSIRGPWRHARQAATRRADQRSTLASITVQAVMLTMRRTVADAVRMCTGRAAPSRTGPIATLCPAAVLRRLYAMLAASIPGR